MKKMLIRLEACDGEELFINTTNMLDRNEHTERVLFGTKWFNRVKFHFCERYKISTFQTGYRRVEDDPFNRSTT